MRSVRYALPILLVAVALSSPASTIDWGSTAGGNFDTGSNWVGGRVPGSGDTAVFGWNPSFRAAQPINITQSITSTIQGIDVQDAVHNLTNVALQFSGGGSLTVGDLMQSNGRPGNATLNFNNGTIEGSGAIAVGVPAGTTGTLNLPNSTINLQSGSGSFQVGIGGTGTVNLPGASIDFLTGSGSFQLGKGAVNLKNSDITFESTSGNAEIGTSGTGTLTLFNSAIAFGSKSGGLAMGVNPGSQGTLAGSGSSVTLYPFGGPVVLGGAGRVSMNIDNSVLLAIQTGSTMDIAQSKGSTANIVVSGVSVAAFGSNGPLTLGDAGNAALSVSGGSSVNMDGSTITIGASGRGSVNVSGGSEFATSATTLGSSAGGSGAVTVTGAKSTWNTGALTIGAAGTGAVTVADGGNVSASTVTVGSHGTLDVEIGGGSSFDELTILSAANLGGTLDITLANGFTPQAGESFEIMKFGSESGHFSSIEGLNIGNGDVFAISYDPTGLWLTVEPGSAPSVPEPAAIWLGLIGVAGLVLRRRLTAN